MFLRVKTMNAELFKNTLRVAKNTLHVAISTAILVLHPAKAQLSASAPAVHTSD